MKVRMMFVAAVLAISMLAMTVPAFATDGCPPPVRQCENPRGQINGWVWCGDGCCKIPRGQIKGWEPCGSGECLNPTGAHNGWEPCGSAD